MAATQPEPVTVAEVGWEDFWEQRGGLQPGEHVSVIGPTNSGKTYALIWFAEDFPGHSVLVVTKGADEMIDRLVSERGWVLSRDLDAILTADGKPGRILKRTMSDWWEKRDRPLQRIVYWPQVSDDPDARAAQLEPLLKQLLARAYAYCRKARSHRLLVEFDETVFAAMELNMNRGLTVIWNEGRAMRLSLAAAMQRTAWVSKSSKSAPKYLLIFDTYDPDDLADLAKLSRFARTRELRDQLDDLPEHHHLLVVTRGRGRQVYRSRVVIRRQPDYQLESGRGG